MAGSRKVGSAPRSAWRIPLALLTSQRGEAGDPADPANPDDKPATPAGFVPIEDFKRMEATLNGRLDQLATSFEAALASRGADRPAPAAVEPAVEDATDAEIEEALASGKGASTLRKMVSGALARYEREVVKPLRELGVNSIARLTEASTLGTREHYARFKKEIDAHLSQMSPALRTAPEALDLAYNAVVGRHEKELRDEAVEAALRQSRESTPPGAPVRRASGRTFAPGKIPGPEELFGKEAADELYDRYGDPDTYVKSFFKGKYKNWDEYATKAMKQQQGDSANA